MRSIGDESSFDWSKFWLIPDQLTSFVEGPLVQTYDQSELARYFDTLVGNLGNNERILDLACGNGAVASAILAAAERHHRVVKLDAVDAARITPREDLKQRVCFSQNKAEQLPFSDNSFARIVSCFGFEFCDQLETLKQVLRVLQPGGRAVFLIYAVESPLVSRMSRYLNFFDHGLKELFELFLADPDQVTLSESKRNQFRRISAELLTYIDQEVPSRINQKDFVGMVQKLSRAPGLHDELTQNNIGRSEFETWLQQTSFEFERKRHIQKVALTSPEARQLVRESAQAGFEDCCVVPFQFQNQLLGWLWDGAKRGPHTFEFP